MAIFKATFHELNGRLTAVFSGNECFKAEFENTVEVQKTDYYGGGYEFTPTQEIQRISIKGKTAVDDIVINAIPSNYGKVEYNGSYILIS